MPWVHRLLLAALLLGLSLTHAGHYGPMEGSLLDVSLRSSEVSVAKRQIPQIMCSGPYDETCTNLITLTGIPFICEPARNVYLPVCNPEYSCPCDKIRPRVCLPSCKSWRSLCSYLQSDFELSRKVICKRCESDKNPSGRRD